MDRLTVITHLQIIHTWAEFARERDLQFFTAKHLEDIAEWSDDALNLLKEQDQKAGHWTQSNPKFESARSNGGSRISTCSNCGGWGRKSFEYCPHCGASMEGR